MPACFVVIGSIASTTQKFVNDVRVQAIGHFTFELEKMKIRARDLKVTLNLQKGRLLLILFFECVHKSNDSLRRNGKTISRSFFSALNVTGFSVSLSLRRLLMQISINLIGNAFFIDISLKWNTFEWNLRKTKTIENVQNNKVRINVGLQYTNVLKSFLVLVIKVSKNSVNL